jgi:oligopeptidase A
MRMMYKNTTVGLPDFNRTSAIELETRLLEVLNEAEADFAALEREIEQNQGKQWSDVVDRLDTMEEVFGMTWGLMGHLNAVAHQDELREAMNRCRPKMVEFELKTSQSEKVFSWFKGLKDDVKTFSQLSPAQQRVVELRLKAAEQSGITLKGEERKKFNEISQKLAQIQTDFSNNVLDATKEFSLLLTKKDEISGLTPRILEMAKHDYQTFIAKTGGVGDDARVECGPYRFSLDFASYLPFMEYSERSDLREKIHRARMTLASDGKHNNTPIIQEILHLRSQLANLLGYSNYAAMSLYNKMAGQVSAASELLESLRKVSFPKAQEEHRSLQTFAKSKGVHNDLWEWDVAYWARRMKEELYQFNEDELRPYFPYPHVVSGLFRLCETLFSVRFVEATSEVTKWHDDVSFYKIVDQKTETHIASFYLDPYSRPGLKRSGAWMNTCLGLRQRGDQLTLPVAYLICNGTPPVKGQPSLMAFHEVNTLFHEFGHGLQHMLTDVREFGVAGINGIEWDAVEVASQFMENWLYHEPTLKSLSCHFETKQPLPHDLVAKLLATKNYRSASQMVRQLQFGITDLMLHESFKHGVTDCHQVALEVSKKTSVFPPRPEFKSLCSFSHIFSGGYSAGYYSYKWAEVLSADAFSAFEDIDMNQESSLKKLGQKYRQTILGQGGARHPMDVFVEFRGRKPEVGALLRHSGLG